MSFDGGGVRIVKTPPRAPRRTVMPNAGYEPSGPNARDRMLIYGESHLRAVLRAYAGYYNDHRLHESGSSGYPVMTRWSSCRSTRRYGRILFSSETRSGRSLAERHGARLACSAVLAVRAASLTLIAGGASGLVVPSPCVGTKRAWATRIVLSQVRRKE
jgi:hypothetical protein